MGAIPSLVSLLRFMHTIREIIVGEFISQAYNTKYTSAAF